MSEFNGVTGSCLCGGVHVQVAKVANKVGACHCGMCRKWGGGPLLAVDCGTEVTFTGEENITTFASSEWAKRGFCKQCGTHLFYHLNENNQYIMPVGLLENIDELLFDHQIFIDKKPSYYSFSNKTADMTEAEVFAMYGA
ncbi:GFA family protein [Neptunomonas qingdaonensis]|uniref:Uncharacterized conserved protein n=1 Tax=Neptunomonas qingdaonensis TaxID=1045558 RepID=A0A1I2USJ7_9GAMM|nr:GFA family protein [Neptunomonas qingdaonensis]SFG80022.1 Uncharacterized conserved protein [Neptunomonas qingdaonensis]